MADARGDNGNEVKSIKAEEVPPKSRKPLNPPPPTVKMTSNKSRPPPVTNAHRKLVQIVSGDNGALDQQLSIFMYAVTMSPEEQQLRYAILEDLKNVLLCEFPEVRIHPFGSLITGLGDNCSDLDIYIDCNGNIKNGYLYQTAQNRKKKEIEFNTVLSILRRLGRKDIKVFGHIIQIPAARVPIIKAIHWRSGISCDLSFENFLSVRNSRLIKLYTKIHPSVRPLMCLLRYWGKFHELIDSTKIKNYGLSLLVLVYLIQTGILPSIYELQYWTPKEAWCRVEDWDASFLENEFILLRKMQEIHGILPPISSRMILQLMLGFFRLYASFNASTEVVCTLTADFLPRRNFCPGYEQELPAELDAYKEWCYGQETKDRLKVTSERAFVVQDPFVLNFNVSAVTSSLSLQRFQCACEVTADFLQKLLNSPVEDFKKAKLMDIFFPIQFPDKPHRDTGEASKKAQQGGGDDDDDENLLPGEKHQQKQMGFSSRPTPEFYQAFFNQFGSCGFPHEEIQFRGNVTWLKFVKEFFLAFFSCYSFDVAITVEYLPRKQPPWPPKQVSRKNEEDKPETPNPVPKVRTKPRHVPRLTELQSSHTQNPITAGTPTGTGDFPNTVDIKKSNTSECTPMSINIGDEEGDGAESDDSSLSLSTIELISAIIRNPSPRELLDAINVTEYAPQRLAFHFSGTSPNVWDGRGTISSQLDAENWKSGTGDPMERENEITRRLAATKKTENCEPIPVSFDCTITLRPDNYKIVYAEVQIRESQGFRVGSVLRALISTMSSIINPYIQYRYSLWTELLPTSARAGPSSPSIPPAQQRSELKQKLKVRKLPRRRPPKSSGSSTLQTEPTPLEHPTPPPGEPKTKNKGRNRGELVFINSAFAGTNNANTPLVSNA